MRMFSILSFIFNFVDSILSTVGRTTSFAQGELFISSKIAVRLHSREFTDHRRGSSILSKYTSAGLQFCTEYHGPRTPTPRRCPSDSMTTGDRRRPLAGLRRAPSVPPCAMEGLTNAERKKRTSFSRSPPPLGRYLRSPPPHLPWRRKSKVWW